MGVQVHVTTLSLSLLLSVVAGECKDREGTTDARDIEKLKRVADALLSDRFRTYIVLAKLAPFTPDEVALAKGLNDRYTQRVILLTARELEPYHFYDRATLEFKNLRRYGGTPEDLAINTAMMYFKRVNVTSPLRRPRSGRA